MVESLLPVPGIQNLPVGVRNAVSSGWLMRFFHLALFSNLVFRASYTPYVANEHLGEVFSFSRKGLLTPVQDAINVPAYDAINSGLTPEQTSKERYSAKLAQYAKLVNTNALESGVAIANLYRENAEDLGLNAAQSLDIQGRRRFMLGYNGGLTYATNASGAPATVITVQNVSGFEYVYSNGLRLPTSVTNPHPITITTTADGTVTRNVTVVTPGTRNDGDDTYPGTLTLDVAVTSYSIGDPLKSNFRPHSTRPNGRTTSHNLIASDTLTYQHLVLEAAHMRSRGVPPHRETNRYHCYLDPIMLAQLWQDAAFYNAFRGLPDAMEFRSGAIGEAGGLLFFETQQPANYVNLGGVTVRRALITGFEAGIECRFAYLQNWLVEFAGASATGAVQFSPESWVALVYRNPIDALQQVISNVWSFIGDWTLGTDTLTSFGGSIAYLKRGGLIEVAG